VIVQERYLGKREEALCDGHDISHLTDGVDSFLHCASMFGAGLIENVLDAVDMSLCP